MIARTVQGTRAADGTADGYAWATQNDERERRSMVRVR
jgi:hypothetical protein